MAEKLFRIFGGGTAFGGGELVSEVLRRAEAGALCNGGDAFVSPAQKLLGAGEPDVGDHIADALSGDLFIEGGKTGTAVMKLGSDLLHGNMLAVMGGSPYGGKGKVLGTISLDGAQSDDIREYRTVVSMPRGCTGKQALYFLFDSPVPETSLCDFIDFSFLPAR